MIINRLIVPEYNNINLEINHTENGEKYVLPSDHRYYLLIAYPKEPFDPLCYSVSDSSHFSFPQQFPAGEYIFEVGIVDNDEKRTVLLPSLDERLKPINQLIILRRLSNEL